MRRKFTQKEEKKSCKKAIKLSSALIASTQICSSTIHIYLSLSHDNSHIFFNECRLLYELWYSWFIKHISTWLILILFFIILIVMSSNGSHPGTTVEHLLITDTMLRVHWLFLCSPRFFFFSKDGKFRIGANARNEDMKIC